MQVAVCMVSAHSPVYEQKMKWFAEGVSDHCDIVDWENLPAYHQNYVPVIYGSVKHKRGARRVEELLDSGRLLGEVGADDLNCLGWQGEYKAIDPECKDQLRIKACGRRGVTANDIVFFLLGQPCGCHSRQ